MVNNKGVVKSLLNASFLLVLTISLLYLYFNAATVYKQDADRWTQVLTLYLVSFSLILVVGLVTARKVVQGLAQANYWQSFLFKFLPSAFVSITVLLLLEWLLKSTGGINPITAISYVPLATLIFHLFVVCQIEEIMFRGIVFEAIFQKSSQAAAYIITAITFALFHYTASGGSFGVLLTYIPLSFAWTYIKLNGYPILNRAPKINQFFGSTRFTQQANAGSHFAWNLFIIGFLKPFQV